MTVQGGTTAGSGTAGSINLKVAAGASITVGDTALSSGTVTVNVGSNNTSGSTTNVTVGSGSAATAGDTTLQAKGAVSITSGTASTYQTTTGNIILQAAGSSTTANVQIGAGNGGSGTSTPDLLVVDDSSSSTDPTEVDGAIYYNASTKNFRCGESGAWVNCIGGLIDSNTAASTAVNSCSSACASFDNARSSIPANYCQAGRVISLWGVGHFSVNSGTTQTLTMGVYYGTNTTTRGSDVLIGVVSPAPASATSASNNFFRIEFKITCFDSTHMLGEGVYTFQNNATTTTSMLTLNMLATASTSVTTTSTKSLYLFPTWQNNNANNTVTLDQWVVSAGN